MRACATSDPGGAVWGGQQGVHLRAAEELHRLSHIALARQSQDFWQ